MNANSSQAKVPDGGVPIVCVRNQEFGTTGSTQRCVSGDCSATGTGTDIGVVALPGVWLALLPSFFPPDPCPIVPLRAAYTWDVAIFLFVNPCGIVS